jgi:hypothetical protein
MDLFQNVVWVFPASCLIYRSVAQKWSVSYTFLVEFSSVQQTVLAGVIRKQPFPGTQNMIVRSRFHISLLFFPVNLHCLVVVVVRSCFFTVYFNLCEYPNQ